jgi:multidrug efflux pump subunit AcrA (membrane-fusion protein)
MPPVNVRNAQYASSAAQRALASAEAAHTAAQARLAQAQAAHAAAGNANAYRQIPTPGETPAAPFSTPLPRGGQGTANYGEKFGLTPVEQQKAGSMSEIQQKSIPQNQQAWERVGGQGDIYPESPLVLTEEARQAAAEAAAQRAQALQADAARAQAQADAAQRITGPALVSAQSEAETAAQQLAAAQSRAGRLQGIVDTLGSSLSPVQQKVLAALGPKAASVMPDVIRGGSHLVGKLFSKLAVPAAVAMVPSEVENAWNAAKQGDWSHAATQGLGALGGTALGVGAGLGALALAPETAATLGTAGAIAGLAPLAQSAYDYFTEPSGGVSGEAASTHP